MDGLTCDAHNDTDASSDVLICDTLSVPDCEDRTVYCVSPPEMDPGGQMEVVNNPDGAYFARADGCRWTKWFNRGKDVSGDAERLEELARDYTWQVCKEPSDIKVRRADTREEVTKDGGVQTYANFDTTVGFVCQDSQQIADPCYDYEIQLCCPYQPVNGTTLKFSCNVENWYLDFNDAPFITEYELTCTNNRY